MEIKEFVCIRCPLGCHLQVSLEDGNVIKVEGNSCPRGDEYGRAESTNPTRTITTIVRVTGGRLPMVSVKTNGEIPKDKIFACMKELENITLQAPVSIGDIILENIAGTGINVVATKDV